MTLPTRTAPGVVGAPGASLTMPDCRRCPLASPDMAEQQRPWNLWWGVGKRPDPLAKPRKIKPHQLIGDAYEKYLRRAWVGYLMVGAFLWSPLVIALIELVLTAHFPQWQDWIIAGRYISLMVAMCLALFGFILARPENSIPEKVTLRMPPKGPTP